MFENRNTKGFGSSCGGGGGGKTAFTMGNAKGGKRPTGVSVGLNKRYGTRLG